MKTGCGYELVWKNCYKGGFDLISPDSFAHPAKMAPSLCYRILDHLKEVGLLNDSDTILDPMSGTGLTAICANAKGIKAITIELEEKFVGFQKENKEYAGRKLCKELDWQIIQGDARKLSELLSERGLVTVSSPPYAEAQTGGGELGRLQHADGHSLSGAGYRLDEHGTTHGQIGNLKDIPLKVITSPPYGIDMKTAGGIDWSKANRHDRRIEVNPVTGEAYTRHNVYGVNVGGYGESEGNIGNLADRPLKTVTSPPYETISYLEAMKIVYAEIAKVSDVLAIVLKNPTRNGKLRRLDLDTIAILEETGWTIHCQHRALLFEELEQNDMFAGPKKKVKGRMSFFKRLSWQKGQPVAAWEDVIIAVRNGGGNMKVVTSPPYQDMVSTKNETEISLQAKKRRLMDKYPSVARANPGGNFVYPNNYGDTPGQIGKLKDK